MPVIRNYSHIFHWSIQSTEILSLSQKIKKKKIKKRFRGEICPNFFGLPLPYVCPEQNKPRMESPVKLIDKNV
jgi:hypothetical protein